MSDPMQPAPPGEPPQPEPASDPAPPAPESRRGSPSGAPRPLGFSGRIARAFLASPLPPLIALAAVLMGLFEIGRASWRERV